MTYPHPPPCPAMPLWRLTWINLRPVQLIQSDVQVVRILRVLIKVRTSSSSKFFLIHWKLTWINIRSVQFIQMSGQSVRWPGGQGGHLCSVMVMMTKTLYFDDFLKFLNCFQVFLFFFYVLNILKKKMIFLIFEKKLLCIIYFCEIL